MFLQTLFSFTVPQLLYAIVFMVVLCVVWVFIQRHLAQLSTAIKWRKVALYGALIVFLLAFFVGHPLLQQIAYFFNGVNTLTTGANASDAQVAADQLVGGWVQIGTLVSKLLAAVAFYITSYTLPWLLQRTTHPRLTEWAKDCYSADFDSLTTQEKFAANSRLQLNQSIRIAAALIAAAQLV